MSVFGHVGAADPLAVWDGVTAWAIGGERVTLAVVELDPSSNVPEHRHDNEQVGVLLRGSMRFRVGDEERELEPGSWWSIPSDTPHSVATGPEGATLVECFVPARADWSALERIAGRKPPLLP